MIDAAIEWQGEAWILVAERALFRRSNSTLYIADAHFGKAATFRAERIAVPQGTTAATLRRLDRALIRTQANRLVILGDLLHAQQGRHAHTMRQLDVWRSANAALRIDLVRGNHDAAAGDPEPELDIACHDGPVTDGGVMLWHHPPRQASMPWIAGHIHPAVSLVGPARESLYLPCFLVQPLGIVLPAFGDFTGRSEVTPTADDRVFVTADDEVIEVPASGRRRLV